ncbi:acidic phospholipase A2-like [Mytilus californianus]|uniref:acidic phospholipase A2-like n=1 Tax=Mytilus californianus TaxID=6549 RepID=UPI002245D590|nr:acidic phospholipase A2-like [Mytilus californianus]
MLTLHYIAACVLFVLVHSSPAGYSKNIFNEVKHFIERSNSVNLNKLKDPAASDAQILHSNMSKKALWNFAFQMSTIFGFSRATELADYGCYCGIGGGGTPLDGLDGCCKAHDDCWGNVESFWCRPYLVGYQYKIINGKTVDCEDSDGTCKYNVCMCDKWFIDCVHINTYNPENYDYQNC